MTRKFQILGILGAILPVLLSCSEPSGQSVEDVLEHLQLNPSEWIAGLNDCPAEHVPSVSVEIEYLDERCTFRAGHCLDRC